MIYPVPTVIQIRLGNIIRTWFTAGKLKLGTPQTVMEFPSKNTITLTAGLQRYQVL